MNFFLRVQNAHGLAGDDRVASFFCEWATTLREMVEAWALQHGVELVGSDEPPVGRESGD